MNTVSEKDQSSVSKTCRFWANKIHVITIMPTVNFCIFWTMIRLQWVIENYISYMYFSTKTYVVGTQKNRLNETVLLSTQNTCLNCLGQKIIIILHSKVLLICYLWWFWLIWHFSFEVCQNERNIDADCFACVVSTHGSEEIEKRKGQGSAKQVYQHCVYGSDGFPVFINDMLEEVQDDTSPYLAGKPKLFFIQVMHQSFATTSPPRAG